MELHAVHLDGRSVGYVDAGERTRGTMIVDPAVRHRFLAGRSWLRHLLSEASGIDIKRLDARFSCPGCNAVDHGQPGWTIDGEPLPIAASLSRSGAWAAAVVDSSRALPTVGIDLEQIGRFGGSELDESVFTPAEQSQLQGVQEAERPRLRAALWSRKEAVLKAAGTGFMVDPATVDVLEPVARLGARDYSVRDVPPAELKVPDGFVVALALSR